MTKRCGALALAAGLLLSISPTLADEVAPGGGGGSPPIDPAASFAQAHPDATAGGFVTGLVDGRRLQLTDVVRGRELIKNLGLPVLRYDHNRRTSVTVTPANDGADIHVSMTNDTDRPVELGWIEVGGFRFGDRIHFWDFRHDGKIVEADSHGEVFNIANVNWPNDFYSPVMVFGDDDHTVGVQILYNALEYKHGVSMWLATAPRWYGDGGRNWQTQFRLDGSLPPGETREYTFAIRVARASDHWLRTLMPYRDFFQRTYGPVQYTRDPRPVCLVNMSQVVALSDSNPRGYTYQSRRPDVNGWGPWVAFMRSLPALGYHRCMMWSPSGLYRANPKWNYPFNFMTPCDDFAPSRTTLGLLATVAGPDMDFGLYWGYSQLVMRGWDQDNATLLDINNPEHVRLAFAELDKAVSCNPQMIGLDSYAMLDPFDSWTWMARMKERAPNVKFMVEPSGCDLMNLQAASWINAYEITSSHVLADFLIPGHELWAGIRFDVIEALTGRAMTPAEKIAEVHRVADLGYIPFMTQEIQMPPEVVAADTATRTVPPEWLLTKSFNINYNPARLVINPDGTYSMLDGSEAPADPNAPAPALSSSPASATRLAGWEPTRPDERITRALGNTTPGAVPTPKPEQAPAESANTGATAGTPASSAPALTEPAAAPGRAGPIRTRVHSRQSGKADPRPAQTEPAPAASLPTPDPAPQPPARQAAPPPKGVLVLDRDKVLEAIRRAVGGNPSTIPQLQTGGPATAQAEDKK